MKHKKLLIGAVVIVLILVAAAIGNYWDSSKPSPSAPPAPPSAEPTPTPAPTPSADAAAEILAAVESVVPDEYRGASYSCDILTDAGGGYIVSLQVDVSVGPPESSDIIAALEASINGLGDARISSVEILAVKDMQIVDNNMGA